MKRRGRARVTFEPRALLRVRGQRGDSTFVRAEPGPPSKAYLAPTVAFQLLEPVEDSMIGVKIALASCDGSEPHLIAPLSTSLMNLSRPVT